MKQNPSNLVVPKARKIKIKFTNQLSPLSKAKKRGLRIKSNDYEAIDSQGLASIKT
jgi:hypothetical protein